LFHPRILWGASRPYERAATDRTVCRVLRRHGTALRAGWQCSRGRREPRDDKLMKGMPSTKFSGPGDNEFPDRSFFPERANRHEMVIFFDIDDTLVDQRKAEAEAARQLLAFYGNWLDRLYSVAEFCGEWRELRDKHNPAFLAGEISLQEQRCRRVRELFARRHKKLPECEIDLFFAFYEYHYRNNWTLFDDVMPFFRSVQGYACGVISNGSAAQQRLKLERTGIAQYFDLFVVAEEIGIAKPDPDIFFAACAQAGYPAGRCVYVGDNLERDALASRAAGMRSIWLDRKQTQVDAPVEKIGSLRELRCRLQQGIGE
jgi:putative hydrolase of the HAD superfamily